MTKPNQSEEDHTYPTQSNQSSHTLWIAKDPRFIHTDSKDSDWTVQRCS